MGDQHDGDAVLLQGRENTEQLVGFLGRQHGAWLVEDQNARAAEQHLQDLDPLLFADRQVRHQRVGIHRQTVFAAEPSQLGARRRQSSRQQRATLGAQYQVLQHRETVDQHEMLVHHADAVGDGVARAVHLHGLAANQDLSRIGAVESVENAHQGRLAGPVFSHDAGNAAGIDAHRHAAHGVDSTERLVDCLEFNCRGWRQNLHVLLLM